MRSISSLREPKSLEGPDMFLSTVYVNLISDVSKHDVSSVLFAY
jgi:hypothetical protein